MGLGYELGPKLKQRQQKKYHKDELELMTTYQLREICKEEKIINGMTAPMEKDQLITQIMRFRGLQKGLFITEHREEGLETLEHLLKTARISLHQKEIRGCATLICYETVAMDFFDQFTIGFDPDLVNTNAILVSGTEICAIFQIRQKFQEEDSLYITKSEQIPCKESNRRTYVLYCMDKSNSEALYRIYQENNSVLPEQLDFFPVEVLNFEVRPLVESLMPLAIDFGTSSTTAGMYLDDAYFEKIQGDPMEKNFRRNDANYLYHYDMDGQIVPTFPTIIGVKSIEEDYIHYLFGHEANRLFEMSHINDGFCVFYDIKRFVADSDKMEEILDQQGRRSYVSRKELVKTYLEYVINQAKQRFKCNIKRLHISAPVKQKKLFHQFYSEILEEYQLEKENMLDEGVCVLYSMISKFIQEKKYQVNQDYKALIIDCGGGTTDLSSCTFSIKNHRVSYEINIKTAYENGDTDFGGNNLTYRIMQMLKLSMARDYAPQLFQEHHDLLQAFDLDLFREVDEKGNIQGIYAILDQEYAKAEEVIPTQFKQWEHRSRKDYYAVKNNFYYIFSLAEQTKQAFFHKQGVLRTCISTEKVLEEATTWIQASRWNLSVLEYGDLVVKKSFSPAYLSIYEINLLLKSDIYFIISKFIGNLYEEDKLITYSSLRLTGQSCKVDLFREALKEFIPGKMIASTKRGDGVDDAYELKLICLNGAISYLKDSKFGFADVKIQEEEGAFPYVISAMTHENKEKILISGLNREKTKGHISRNMTDITLELFLKDPYENLRYTYSYTAVLDDFSQASPEDIVEKFGNKLFQDDLDDIVQREMKFFILSQPDHWGFSVIPVYRFQETLFYGKEKFFSFETEGWLNNFFDGTR